jgi:hypothetical protein
MNDIRIHNLSMGCGYRSRLDDKAKIIHGFNDAVVPARTFFGKMTIPA